MTPDTPTPGVRWQRPAKFAEDRDVSELYRILCEQGSVQIELMSAPARPAFESPMDYLEANDFVATFHALQRRAAEDGFTARATGGTRGVVVVSLTGPLTEEQADPWSSIRADADRWYRELASEPGEWKLSTSGSYHALAGIFTSSELLEEIGRLAAARGRTLERKPLDDIGWSIRLI